MFSFLKKKKNIEIKSPVNGLVKKIEDVKDQVFSEKIMGDGVAIQIEDGDVYAPVSGTITSVILPSSHAFGITTKEVLEVLVHVGLDTVNLKNGEFTLLKQQGDYVNMGEPVIKINYDLLSKLNIDLITPVVITNSKNFNLQKKIGFNVQYGNESIIECSLR